MGGITGEDSVIGISFATSPELCVQQWGVGMQRCLPLGTKPQHFQIKTFHKHSLG